jgi:hypothetical protein
MELPSIEVRQKPLVHVQVKAVKCVHMLGEVLILLAHQGSASICSVDMYPYRGVFPQDPGDFTKIVDRAGSGGP